MPRSKKYSQIAEIDSVIARLFARNGYQSTTIRDIARELGITPASLYYYYKSKEEMLFRLMKGAMESAMVTIEDISLSDLSPEDKIKQVLTFYTRYFAGYQDCEILLQNEIKSLNEEHREIVIQKQRRYLHLFYGLLRQLSEHGKMKPIHHTVAIFAFLGMVHFTVRWYDPEGPVSLDVLSDMFVEIFTNGILCP